MSVIFSFFRLSSVTCVDSDECGMSERLALIQSRSTAREGGVGSVSYLSPTSPSAHYIAVPFFFFLFMSDAHHGINSSTQKYQSTPSSVVLTSCRQDSGSPPF